MIVTPARAGLARLITCLCLFAAWPALAVDQPVTPTEAEVRKWAEDYFALYAARDDWEGFLDQFVDELEFEDPVADISLNSKSLFREFYFWPDTAFSKHPDYPQTLVLEELIVNGRQTIGRGYFTPFRYLGVTFAENRPMRFTIWLDWNTNGRITRQVDWIAYPPELMRSMYCRESDPVD